MKKNENVYQEFLYKHHLKSTRQRSLMFETFFEIKEHVSAEEFCAIIKKIDPTVGQATVYRMLKLLAESGIARRLEMGGGLAVYELNAGKEHHDHLICETCFKCIEFNDEEIEKLQIQLAESYGFVLSGHKMFLYGICPDCCRKTGAPGAC